MTDVKIYEKDGIYTAYHIELVRGPDGKMQEVPVSIYIPIPNAEDLFSLRTWTEGLTDQQLNIAVQIFFDKWNFSSGDGRHKLVLEALTNERDTREENEPTPHAQYNMFSTWPTAPSRKGLPPTKKIDYKAIGNKVKNRLVGMGIKKKNPPKRLSIEDTVSLADRIRMRMKGK